MKGAQFYRSFDNGWVALGQLVEKARQVMPPAAAKDPVMVQSLKSVLAAISGKVAPVQLADLLQQLNDLFSIYSGGPAGQTDLALSAAGMMECLEAADALARGNKNEFADCAAAADESLSQIIAKT